MSGAVLVVRQLCLDSVAGGELVSSFAVEFAEGDAAAGEGHQDRLGGAGYLGAVPSGPVQVRGGQAKALGALPGNEVDAALSREHGVEDGDHPLGRERPRPIPRRRPSPYRHLGAPRSASTSRSSALCGTGAATSVLSPLTWERRRDRC
jgi:hypothetical protein